MGTLAKTEALLLLAKNGGHMVYDRLLWGGKAVALDADDAIRAVSNSCGKRKQTVAQALAIANRAGSTFDL